MRKFTPSEAPRALLFDLDGTLLEITMSTFLEAYYRALAPHFDALSSFRPFVAHLIASVREMMSQRGGESLLIELFYRGFSRRVNLSRDEVESRFESFYLEGFEGLQSLTRPVEGARSLLERALAKGHEIALATNPVFPETAITSRLRWAGCADLPFRFVSTAENMHTCKPHPEYFTEVRRNLRRRAGECLMVGNDAEKDLPARRTGISTFHVVPEGDTSPPHPEADSRGTLADLARMLDL